MRRDDDDSECLARTYEEQKACDLAWRCLPCPRTCVRTGFFGKCMSKELWTRAHTDIHFVDRFVRHMSDRVQALRKKRPLDMSPGERAELQMLEKTAEDTASITRLGNEVAPRIRQITDILESGGGALNPRQRDALIKERDSLLYGTGVSMRKLLLAATGTAALISVCYFGAFYAAPVVKTYAASWYGAAAAAAATATLGEPPAVAVAAAAAAPDFEEAAAAAKTTVGGYVRNKAWEVGKRLESGYPMAIANLILYWSVGKARHLVSAEGGAPAAAATTTGGYAAMLPPDTFGEPTAQHVWERRHPQQGTDTFVDMDKLMAIFPGKEQEENENENEEEQEKDVDGAIPKKKHPKQKRSPYSESSSSSSSSTAKRKRQKHGRSSSSWSSSSAPKTKAAAAAAAASQEAAYRGFDNENNP